ncbi:hypothetical protein [Halalkalibacter flavus]|uniref:hypothetical protein n=1 Tax=Halalkalibacter flavus TaxID=3090668 RepID=UPI002FCC8D21
METTLTVSITQDGKDFVTVLKTTEGQEKEIPRLVGSNGGGAVIHAMNYVMELIDEIDAKVIDLSIDAPFMTFTEAEKDWFVREHGNKTVFKSFSFNGEQH